MEGDFEKVEKVSIYLEMEHATDYEIRASYVSNKVLRYIKDHNYKIRDIHGSRNNKEVKMHIRKDE